MRYVEGSDLKTVLGATARSRPSARSRCSAQVADALDAAHRRGLVHRDVKPAQRPARRGRARVPDRLRRHQASSAATRPRPARWSARSTTSPPSRSAARPVDARSRRLRARLRALRVPGRRAAVPPRDARPRRCGRTCRSDAAAAAEHPALDAGAGARRSRRSQDDRYASCGELIDDAPAPLGSAARGRPSARRRGCCAAAAPSSPPGCSCSPRPTTAAIVAI